MAKAAGRTCLIQKSGTTIAGVRSISISFNGTPIDVTDQGDSGNVNYLSDVMTGKTVEATVDGIEEDQVLQGIATGADSGKFLSDLTIDLPSGTTLSGNWVMTAYSETGPYEEAQTFTATFVSNGAIAAA